MMESKRVPISAAKAISKKYNKDQVLIITWDYAGARVWCSTYGIDKKNCSEVAVLRARFMDFLGMDMK